MARATAGKLTNFYWEGVARSGRTVKGEMEGTSVAFINATLRRRGVNPRKVRRKGKPLVRFGQRITPRDIAFATRQTATMIGAGIPIAQGLSAVARGHEKARMRDLLNSIRQGVEAGTTLSQSLAHYPQYFDRLYTNLVAVGEESGTLDNLLEKVATHLEKIEIIKGKVKAALFYPAMVVLVAIVVVSLLLIFVIPVFDNLFKNFGAQLPTLTQEVMNFSRWFQEWWWLLLGALTIALVGFSIAYKRSPKVQSAVDRLLLRLPIFGSVIRKAVIARYARTLATMFGAGVPLVDALNAVAGATGNRIYHDGILGIRDEVNTGRPLAESMEHTRLFPSMVTQMVETGEETGELELMLNKAAEFYEREVDNAVAAISSLIEPVMIVVLGIIVGTIVIAMYLPIFKMASVF